MKGYRTEGIILKRRNFGEADRILTIFTHQRGKISVLAKGVRRITSKRAGNVELLNRVLIYLHQGKGMPILTEAKSLDTFSKLKEDLTLSTYAYHILELIDKLTAENILSSKDYFDSQNQENRALYGFLMAVLKRFSKNPRQILIRAFEAKILVNLGFVSFQAPGVAAKSYSEAVTNILKRLETDSWDEIEKIKINEKEALELERILSYHLERAMEGSLKSRKFLRKM